MGTYILKTYTNREKTRTNRRMRSTNRRKIGEHRETTSTNCLIEAITEG